MLAFVIPRFIEPLHSEDSRVSKLGGVEQNLRSSIEVRE